MYRRNFGSVAKTCTGSVSRLHCFFSSVTLYGASALEPQQLCKGSKLCQCNVTCTGTIFVNLSFLNVGTRGTWSTCPQDFAINKEMLFLFIENAPFFLRKKMPSKRRAPSSRCFLRPCSRLHRSYESVILVPSCCRRIVFWSSRNTLELNNVVTNLHC